MNLDKRLKRIILVFIFCILVGFFISSGICNKIPILSFISDKINQSENSLYDSHMNAQKRYLPSDKIILISIDNKSQEKLGSFPWQRKYHAQLIDNLTKAKVKLIVFDIDFSTKSNRKDDKIFAQAIKNSNKIISSAFLKIKDNGQCEKIFPIKELKKNLIATGSPQVIKDRDNIVRKIRIFNKKFGPFDPLSIATFRKYYNLSSITIFSPNKSYAKIGVINIPIDTNYDFLINFTGIKYPRISYINIIQNKFNKNKVKDKIAIVLSNVDPKDQFKVPKFIQRKSQKQKNLLFGGEIHANALQTLLEKRFIYPIPQRYSLLLGFLFCFIGIIILTKLNHFQIIPVFTAILISYFFVCRWLFTHKQIWINFILPSFILFIFWLGIFVLESQRLKEIFIQFLPRSAGKKMIKSSRATKLGGKTKVATVLFSDIRSYTSMSEGEDPKKILELLNEFHKRVSNVIEKNKGSIFHYAGDGMMAVFGAPDDLEDHASKAVKAAIEMQEAAIKMNKEISIDNIPPIKIGVGVCTGNIAYGLMGRDSLKNYTAIGDVVNTSARLQGLSEKLKSPIIISKSTKDKIKENFSTYDLGEVYLKGKTNLTKIFGISSNYFPLEKGLKVNE